MKKLFLFSLMCLMALAMHAQSEAQYVDLGLASGTLWKSTNEEGGFYSFDEGVNKFGNRMPTRVQWRELLHSCIWIWTGNGYKITGANGNSIYLPAAGFIYCDGRNSPGNWWCYWTSTPKSDEPNVAYSINMGPDLSDESIIFGKDYRCIKRPIRLIQNRTIQAQHEPEYVDLGLPSGTLWRASNEDGGLYDYYKGKKKYGDKIPKKRHWEELLEKCTWTWTGQGYRVTGCNGKYIFLPATGWRNYYGDGGISLIGSYGAYWSFSHNGQNAWGLGFDEDAFGIGFDHCSSERSIRLIKEK